ncbi:MAG TPA: MFS transporter [Bordetella sp.]
MSLPRTPSPRLALLSASLGFVIICLDVTVVNVALERIQLALNTDVAGLQWVLNAYTLAFASLLLSAGALGDRLGAKPVFIGGLALFTVASLACGLAPGIGALVAARLLQGVAAALCVPSSLALLNASFPEPRARVRAVSIWAGTASLAIGAGPIVGGLLVDRFGWASVFLVNLPIGLAGIGLAWVHAPGTPRGAGHGFDLRGQALAIAALAALTFGFVESGPLGWGHPAVVAGFVGAAVAGAGFLRVERRQAHPMLPLSLFQIPVVGMSSLVGLSLNFGYYGLMFALSLFFQVVKGYPPLTAGLAFLPMTAVVVIANLASGALTVRFGHKLPMVAGQALAALGCFALAAIDADSRYVWTMVPLLAVGIGTALVVPSINTALLANVDRSQVGIAAGVQNTARQIGGVIGVGVFGSLLGGEAGGMAQGLHVAVTLAGVGLAASCAWVVFGMRARAPCGACGP